MNTINPVTLEEVNNHLLERLDALIDNAEGEALLKVTEAIAKLNTSRRNSLTLKRAVLSAKRSTLSRQ